MQAIQGGGGCPSCAGQASKCCQQGMEALQNGDQDGLKEILELLRKLIQQDPTGVLQALQQNPQFTQALSGAAGGGLGKP